MPALIAALEALRHPKSERQGAARLEALRHPKSKRQGAARLKPRPAQSPTGTEFRAVADIMGS